MSKLDKNAVLEILLLAIQIGVPAVKKLIEAWDKDEITLEEIKALADIKRPDEFRDLVMEIRNERTFCRRLYLHHQTSCSPYAHGRSYGDHSPFLRDNEQASLVPGR